MTPAPPSSSDGSALPPRHRPTLGNLAKDTTEMDLWAFEDELDPTTEAEQIDAPRGASKIVPTPRERQSGTTPPRKAEERQISKTPTGGEDRIRMNVNKVRGPDRSTGKMPAGHSTPESDFEELENWEDIRIEAPDIEELPAEAESELVERLIPQEPLVEKPQEMPQEPGEAAIAPAEDSPIQDEFAAVVPANAKPVSLLPKLGLTKIERIGMVALLVMLVVGAISILVVSLSRIPTDTLNSKANHFPIKGSHLTIESATSFWRLPVTDGPNPDTFRRGTRLLPVLEIKVTGGPAALRVLFRNDEGAVVGDAVTRVVRSAGTLKIPATAGFDDFGMHAAYRTGGGPPWTIVVSEAPSEVAAGTGFKKLFEMNISTERR